MKRIVKYISALVVIITIVSCTTDEKTFPDVELVPVYSIPKIFKPSSDNDVATGYQDLEVPTQIEIYKEKDLVINFSDNSLTSFEVSASDNSTAYDSNTSTPGRYEIEYSTFEEIVDEDNGITTVIDRDYDISIEKTTDANGATLPTEGVGMVINETKVVTTVADFETGDVDGTVTDGIKTTTVTVDSANSKTTTVETTVSLANCKIEIISTKVYN